MTNATSGADVFSHTWLGGLFGDAEVAGLIAPDVMLKHMIAFEQAYALALGDAGVVPVDVAKAAAQAIAAFEPDMDDLHAGTARDGLVIPGLVKQLKTQIDLALHTAVHTGLTSQDVIDTALVLCLREVSTTLNDRLQILAQDLDRLDATAGGTPLMGRTRMQAAVEITAHDRLRTWRTPLTTHQTRLARLLPDLLQLQFGGAAGNRAALGANADDVAAALAKRLDLANPPTCWHAERDTIVEFANWLSLVTGTLGKMGQDIALMAQQGLDEITLTGGGGSSAMPHKQNPVQAELLITLARFNATQVAGMHHALIHEQERSGAAWALEWMILPQMIMATARALHVGSALIGKVKTLGKQADGSAE